MLKNNAISVFTIILLTTIQIFSAVNADEMQYNTNIDDEIPESYLISGVPYVGQKTSFHCGFASATMQLNYFGANTTLNEVIFLSGGGFSHQYYPESDDRLPIVSHILTSSRKDRAFLANLFGFSHEIFYPDITQISHAEYQESYWSKIKENISQNRPVLAGVNACLLTSVQNQFNLPKFFWNFLRMGHDVVIVGYNKSNCSICFNDPYALYYGSPDLGKYAWMNKTDFYKAAMDNPIPYYTEIFYKNTECLRKNTIHDEALLNNIEKLKGNISSYDADILDYFGGINDSFFGINATKKLMEHYGKGKDNRLKTTFIYKKAGKFGIERMIYLICKYFPNFFNKTPVNTNMQNQTYFDIIAIEKHIVSEHLKNLSSNYNYYSNLLFKESQNWSKLSEEYKKFLKKGFLMTNIEAFLILDRMEAILENIISLEDSIIRGEQQAS